MKIKIYYAERMEFIRRLNECRNHNDIIRIIQDIANSGSEKGIDDFKRRLLNNYKNSSIVNRIIKEVVEEAEKGDK